MTKRIIFNGDIANEGKCFRGYIVINDEFIETVAEGEPSAALLSECDERNDVDGALVMPGDRRSGAFPRSRLDVESRFGNRIGSCRGRWRHVVYGYAKHQTSHSFFGSVGGKKPQGIGSFGGELWLFCRGDERQYQHVVVCGLSLYAWSESVFRRVDGQYACQ